MWYFLYSRLNVIILKFLYRSVRVTISCLQTNFRGNTHMYFAHRTISLIFTKEICLRERVQPIYSTTNWLIKFFIFNKWASLANVDNWEWFVLWFFFYLKVPCVTFALWSALLLLQSYMNIFIIVIYHSWVMTIHFTFLQKSSLCTRASLSQRPSHLANIHKRANWHV